MAVIVKFSLQNLSQLPTSLKFQLSPQLSLRPVLNSL